MKWLIRKNFFVTSWIKFISFGWSTYFKQLLLEIGKRKHFGRMKNMSDFLSCPSLNPLALVQGVFLYT